MIDTLNEAGRMTGERKRLLVVDDEPLSRALTIVMLREHPLEVIGAETGFEALERIAREPFDLVLMDVSMPGLDGYHTCRRLREWERALGREPVPVVALTGHVCAENRQKACLSGMSDYLEKPLRRHRLQEMLSRWLGVGSDAAMESAEPVAEPEAEMLDVQRLEVLRRELLGVSGAFVTLLGMFLEEVPLRLVELRRLSGVGEFATVSRLAHGMKSQCGALGAMAMNALCVRLEQSAEQQESEALPVLLDRVEGQFARLAPRLRQILEHPERPIA
ncbi:MAG: response regulator [Magnetococcales bacterium]|nr:response regulator [Magnetococcales bacterium]